MTDARKPQQKPSDAELRAQRLKAALKANMAKRKAQARARKAPEGPSDDTSEQ
ncbi:hypothetical protein [Palleronia pelagia]|uniref:Uncharacterized protein n=1 Tax=Palleronia pelagia TaxID=387096 RepID=A0A1H8HBG4_9RHOB|nr:hypothetical protein [Palleronia pelagia]SEN53450.1 hypothetical protein SAMN04488011_104376 [Palleronia pelagia]